MKLRSIGVALALLLCAEGTSHANGRFPASNAITFDPSDPSRIYLRATFGLLVSTDGGRSWDWVCERSLGFSGPEDPTIGIFGDGSVVVSLFEGLAVSHDRACSFSFVPGTTDKKIFVDVSVVRTNVLTAAAITSGYANKNDAAGNALFSSEVFVSRDYGKNWEKSGPSLDPTLLLQTVDVSPLIPNRIFISATRGSAPNANGVLLRSDDGGLTFTERPIPLTPKVERAPFIAALDPNDGDALWVRTMGTVDQGARLLYTRDLGQTWKNTFQTKGPMKGFALSEDGNTIFAGGPKDGVWSAEKKDAIANGPVLKVNDLAVACLAYRKGELWACSDEANGFTAGISTTQGRSWQPRAHLKDLRGPLACAAGTPTFELCRADWPQQRAFLGIEAPSVMPDASTPTDAGPRPSQASASRCSCNAVGGSSSGAWRSVVLAAALVSMLRARRRVPR